VVDWAGLKRRKREGEGDEEEGSMGVQVLGGGTSFVTGRGHAAAGSRRQTSSNIGHGLAMIQSIAWNWCLARRVQE
jgi:hypothetical protein